MENRLRIKIELNKEIHKTIGRVIFLHNYIYDKIIEELFNRKEKSLISFLEEISIRHDKFYTEIKLDNILDKHNIEYTKVNFIVTEKSLKQNDWFNRDMNNFIYYKIDDNEFYLNGDCIVCAKSINWFFTKNKLGELSINKLDRVRQNISNDKSFLNEDGYEYTSLLLQENNNIELLNKIRNHLAHNNEIKDEWKIEDVVNKILMTLYVQLCKTTDEETALWCLEELFSIFPKSKYFVIRAYETAR